MAKTLVAIMVSGASAYQLRAPLTHADATRGRSARMGGFEQKLLPLTDDVEARVSLQLSGAAELLEPVTASCRKVASSASLTGIMYAIERLNKLEVIAEGGRESLEELVRLAHGCAARPRAPPHRHRLQPPPPASATRVINGRRYLAQH